MKKRKILLTAGIMAISVSVFIPTIKSKAESSEVFKSRGVIRYTDTSGGEVVFDAGDLDVLFRSAAEGKNGILTALGGVGTRFTWQEGQPVYSRDPQFLSEEEIQTLLSFEALQDMPFAVLLEAVESSQQLPPSYTDSYSLAISDNLTLGYAGWADGSLVLGNNHDLLEHYAKGWMEGAGYQTMIPVKDESGNVIGYRFE